MRKIFWIALALLASSFLLPASSSAQVLVTGTIRDPNGVPYTNGTISFQIVPGGTTPCYPTGPTCASFSGFQQGNLGPSGTLAPGAFSVNLFPNNSITPGGTQWQITVTTPGAPAPLGTGPQSFSTLVTINGAVDLSGVLSAAAPALSASGGQVIGVCTGVATASSTLGLYGTGSNETLSTCTSATIGNGIPASAAKTLHYLYVTSTAGGVNGSSGVVTVLKNGGATTITCTLGTGTSCSDATHSVALAIGDLISIQFTTQAADTLAGVKAIVSWN